MPAGETLDMQTLSGVAHVVTQEAFCLIFIEEIAVTGHDKDSPNGKADCAGQSRPGFIRQEKRNCYTYDEPWNSHLQKSKLTCLLWCSLQICRTFLLAYVFILVFCYLLCDE